MDEETNVMQELLDVMERIDMKFDDIMFANVVIHKCDRIKAFLPPGWRDVDMDCFKSQLISMNSYDSGYGSQKLFGTIVFKNSAWLERGEYDGSEWWQFKKMPSWKQVKAIG